MMTCVRCGASVGLLSAFTADSLCPECQRKQELSKLEQQKRESEIIKRAESVIVTTTPQNEQHSRS
jgi:uncharacterized Zn finger protein (UPF0148 family)